MKLFCNSRIVNLLLVATVASVASVVNGEANISDDVPPKEDVDCRAGASSISFEGTCDSRDHTFTTQCDVEERDVDDGMGGTKIECAVSEDDCGCLYWEPSDVEAGFVYGLESNPDKCNACFVHGYTPEVSDDVPENTECKASGTGMSFAGSCRSRNHTFTSQCQVDEKNGDCVVTENECGCLYWTPDDVEFGQINGLENNPDKCDACNVHGYEAKDSGATTTQPFVTGLILATVAAALL